MNNSSEVIKLFLTTTSYAHRSKVLKEALLLFLLLAWNHEQKMFQMEQKNGQEQNFVPNLTRNIANEQKCSRMKIVPNWIENREKRTKNAANFEVTNDITIWLCCFSRPCTTYRGLCDLLWSCLVFSRSFMAFLWSFEAFILPNLLWSFMAKYRFIGLVWVVWSFLAAIDPNWFDFVSL